MTRLFLALLAALAVAAAAPSPALAQAASPAYLNAGTVLPKGLPFSEAVRVGDLVFLSGMVGVQPGTMTLVPGGMKAEAKQALDNIRAVLAAHGYTMDDVVKCTVMLTDMAEWGAFNDIYKAYFPKHFPARSALGTNGLALGARVEVECMAAARRAEPVAR